LKGYDNIELFKGDIDPNDILQGGLGTCYLLCSIASLAERPERIKKLFVNTQKNKQGIYGVKIFRDGAP
jgi:calpain-15